MPRKKISKNPNVTDEQRDRALKRRLIELTAETKEHWKHTRPKTVKQKFVDFMEGKKIDDHITDRTVKVIIWGLKYGEFYFPKTKDEKYDDRRGLDQVYKITNNTRKDPHYKYVSLGNEILHENPDTKDQEYVLFDFNAERSKNTIKKSQVLVEWETNRTELTDSMIDITNKVVENAQIPRSELEKLRRAEQERRRRERESNNDDNEDEESE